MVKKRFYGLLDFVNPYVLSIFGKSKSGEYGVKKDSSAQTTLKSPLPYPIQAVRKKEKVRRHYAKSICKMVSFIKIYFFIPKCIF